MSRQEDFREMSKDLHVQLLSNPWTIYETGCEDGYQYEKQKIKNYLLCVELSNFFPNLSDEEADKGKKDLIKAINDFLEDL
jgi:hypothetical protein